MDQNIKMSKIKKTPKKTKVTVREATRNDIPRLVELNRISYPQMAEDNVVWGESHLLCHQRTFPQGQLVAEINGQIMGACSSLIVNVGPDPLRNHTWAGATDSGFFYNHDPKGDTLYGADIYAHPDARGIGVGAALYEARRKICKRFNLRRILAGGRLWNYAEYADLYTPQEYALRVVRGDIKDLVLSFQLRQGFILRGILSNYIRDQRSHNYASLIEWLNPEYKQPTQKSRKVRIACVQYQMRKINSFQEFANQVRYFTDIAADYRSDFVLFPELFSVQLLSQMDALSPSQGMKKLADYANQYIKLMTSLSSRYGLTIIAGSHPVREGKNLVNTSFVCLPDGKYVAQPKLHVTPNERKWWNITGGRSLNIIDTPKAKIGVLICYDIEFPEAARYLADEGAEIIFVPFCTDNRQGFLRVRSCAQARAIENQIYVALAGNVGNLPSVNNMDIQYGQAAVLTPSDFAFARDGIQAESDRNVETMLVCDLDLDDLHENRSDGTVTPRLDRRSDLFDVVYKIKDSAPPGEPLGGQDVSLYERA